MRRCTTNVLYKFTEKKEIELMIVLGIHGGVTVGQHEPGASVIINGRVIAVCEEEDICELNLVMDFFL